MSAEEKWVGSKSVALLRQGPFRRYIIGSLISDSGTWMQMMAQSWVMSGLTSKAILLGLVNFAAGLPALILAPVAGSLADRLDKRKILVATQIAQIIFAVALGLLVMSGQIRIWHIVFFALLLGIAFSYEMPAISALVPELVKRDGVGIFHKRALVCRTNRCTHVPAETAYWHTGGRKTTSQRDTGGLSLRSFQSHHRLPHNAHRAEHDFRFPSDLGDAPSLRTQHP
jgi:transmembrane secretion effector